MCDFEEVEPLVAEQTLVRLCRIMAGIRDARAVVSRQVKTADRGFRLQSFVRP
jgi:hypothetical protein